MKKEEKKEREGHEGVMKLMKGTTFTGKLTLFSSPSCSLLGSVFLSFSVFRDSSPFIQTRVLNSLVVFQRETGRKR